MHFLTCHITPSEPSQLLCIFGKYVEISLAQLILPSKTLLNLGHFLHARKHQADPPLKRAYFFCINYAHYKNCFSHHRWQCRFLLCHVFSLFSTISTLPCFYYIISFLHQKINYAIAFFIEFFCQFTCIQWL